MKKLLLLAFVSTISLAQDTYCPESITCIEGTCTLNPDNGFFIRPGVYNKTDAIYYFTRASAYNPNYPYYQDEPPRCDYYSANGDHIYLLPAKKIIAHAPLQNTEWTTPDSIAWTCHNNDSSKDSPQNCPFTVVEASNRIK